ncbi:hypothetical protein ANN_02688 [Periplaneta americana]|uniref:Uncharacterized protein n=1 Tax=Periplaneta americana TaxID=6978 RepID=A0ABQ8TX67_PERAM|nr:hypothetical protein ANN_02688 [Periplaneta americana]
MGSKVLHCDRKGQPVCAALENELAIDLFEHIEQRFLLSGHSFLQCDFNFALIEKRKKVTKAFIPSDLLKIVQDSKFVKRFQTVPMLESDFLNTQDVADQLISNKNFNISKLSSYLNVSFWHFVFLTVFLVRFSLKYPIILIATFVYLISNVHFGTLHPSTLKLHAYAIGILNCVDAALVPLHTTARMRLSSYKKCFRVAFIVSNGRNMAQLTLVLLPQVAEVHFMYGKTDGNAALAHRSYQEKYPDRRIGRGGPIAWPPRSPDLNPIDFYLWGYLKSLVYSSPVPDMESLRNRIVADCEEIRNTPGIWDRVRRAMRHRYEACIQAGGGHFEHLL